MCRHARCKYLHCRGTRLRVTFSKPVPPAVVRGALGIVTRDEVVPGAVKEHQRRDRGVYIAALTDVVHWQRVMDSEMLGSRLPVGRGCGRHYHHL